MQAPNNLTQQPGFERKANSFGANLTAWHINHGVCQGPGITVVPVADLVKERELPSKWRPLVKQAAGHCRSRSESACVRKLLQAVRAANVSPDGQEGDDFSKKEPSLRPHSAKQWRTSGLRSPQVKPGSFGPPSPLQRPRSARQRTKGYTATATFPNGSGNTKAGARPRPHSASAARAKSQNESMRRLYAREPSGVGPSGRNLRFPASSPSPVDAATVHMPTQNFATTATTTTGSELLLEIDERPRSAVQLDGRNGIVDGEGEGGMCYSPGRTAEIGAAVEQGSAHPSKRLSQGTGRFMAVPKASPLVTSSALAGGAAGSSSAEGSPNQNRRRVSHRGSSNKEESPKSSSSSPRPLLGIVQSPLGDLIGDPPPPLRYGKFVNMVTRVGVPLEAVRHMVSQEQGLTQEGFDAALTFVGVDLNAPTVAAASNTAAAPAVGVSDVSMPHEDGARQGRAEDDGASTAVKAQKSPSPIQRPALPSGLMAGISGGGSRLKAVNRNAIRDASAPTLLSSNSPTSNSAEAAASLAALLESYEKWISSDAVIANLPLQHLFRQSDSAAALSGQDRSNRVDERGALSWQRLEVLGAGRYATVAVAAKKASSISSTTSASTASFAVKEFTFSGSSAPEGVLRAWQREANALVALDQAAAAATPAASSLVDASTSSDARPLIVRLLGCSVSPPRLALELALLGSLALYLKKRLQEPLTSPQSTNSKDGGEVSSDMAVVAGEVAAAAQLSFTLLRDVAAALAFVHSAGWCHLDVKDHNVVLRQRQDLNSSIDIRTEAILADFGTAARLGDQLSLTSALRAGAGTSGSAAPELLAAAEALDAHAAGVTASHMMSQDTGQDAIGGSTKANSSSSSAETAEVAARVAHVGAPADVFSFGILLWRCLVPMSLCVNPLAGLDGATALAALKRGVRPPWPRSHNHSATAASSIAETTSLAAVKAIGELLQRCWAFEPEARPTMAEVCRDLSKVCWVN